VQVRGSSARVRYVCVCVHSHYSIHLQTQTPLAAADFEYAPEDIILQSFEHHTTKHGLGYKPLEHTSVLSETYGKKSEGYKEKGGDKVRTTSDKTRAKGIRGQVGGCLLGWELLHVCVFI
jgi:hypothetical protein